MSLFHDIKYTQLLSPHLSRFKRKSEYLWNFRCPICGDSKKKQSKSRGYIYKKKNDLFFKCHNCGIGLSLGNFIKFVNQALYNDYVLERYSHGESARKPHTKPDFDEYKPKVIKPILDLPNILDLKTTHIAYKYLTDRKIPEQHLHLFYYAEDFQEWAQVVTDGQFKQKYFSETTDPRIVIPFLDRGGNLVAIQARALLPVDLRYITIKFDETKPKVFGLERWNPNQITYITEGPFDSLFLPNCLAMAGSSVDISTLIQNKDETVYIFDNEKRNKEIVNQMLKIVNAGYKIVVWPETVVEKDINDMILFGKSSDVILQEIVDNTKSGLEAILSINCWKKC